MAKTVGQVGNSHTTVLTLGRLTQEQCRAMVDHVTAGRTLPTEVLTQILGRADGVPLSVEELTKTLVEFEGVAGRGDRYVLAVPLLSQAVPGNAPGLVDGASGPARPSQGGGADRRCHRPRVQPGAARRRRAAAGGTAAHRACPPRRGRAGLPPRQAARSELQLQARFAPGRRIARCSKSKRQHLHARIAQVLEEQFHEIADLQPALLAHHCTEAGLTANAVDYRCRAARLAVAQSAHLEAIAQATKGLEALAGLPDGPERRRQELDLQLALGRGFLIAKGEAAPETGSAYSRAVELCAQVDAIAQMFPALYGRLLFHSGS